MAKIGEEIKKTFDSLVNSMKSEEKEDMVHREEERKLTQEKEQSHQRLVEKANSDFGRKQEVPTSKNLSSVTQNNRPVKAIIVNESSTVKVMEPKMKDDVFLIIGELRNKQPVLIKLGSVEQNIKRSILDSLYGACSYAGYSLEQVDSQIILIDPSHKPTLR
jgi:FtsZ-interacting cell division protein YlmF